MQFVITVILEFNLLLFFAALFNAFFHDPDLSELREYLHYLFGKEQQ